MSFTTRVLITNNEARYIDIDYDVANNAARQLQIWIRACFIMYALRERKLANAAKTIQASWRLNKQFEMQEGNLVKMLLI